MTKTTLRSYNREIEAITDQGKIDLAIAHCLHILKFFPKHVDTYRQLGKAYLENKRLGDAADVFQRVLSAVPDDFVSHIGMSIIREDEGNLDASIWHMQRAYDVQSSNITIQDELRRLFDKRDGVEPPKIRLTRAALARMYARGDLISEAIGELRAALQEDPDRADLLALLARMHATNNQRVKAIQTAGKVLAKLPYCLDANLVMGQALIDTNRAGEAQGYQERARELDPYTAFISEQAPSTDLVPDAAVTLLALDEDDIRVAAQSSHEQPDWVTSLGEEMAPQTSGEGPFDWLVEDEGETGPVPESSGEDDAELAESLAASAAFDSAIAGQGEDEGESGGEAGLEEEEDAIPDWMQEAGWLAGTGETGSAEQAESAEGEESEGEVDDSGLFKADIPEWLQAMAPGEGTDETGETAPQPAVETEAQAEGLEGQETVMEFPEQPEESDGESLPDWLQDEPVSESETPPAGQDAGEIPDWLLEGAPEGAPEGALEGALEGAPESAPESAPEGAQEQAGEGDAGELPGWLSDAGDESEGAEQAAQADQPVWLEDIDPTAAPVTESDSEDLATLSAGEATDLADLLAGISFPGEEGEAELGVGESGAGEDGGEDVPDWLKDMADKAASTSSALAGEPEDTTGVTLWLKRNTGSLVPEAAEPGEGAAAEEPEGAEAGLEDSESPAQGDVPDWLQGLDSELLGGAGGAEEAAEAATAEAAGGEGAAVAPDAGDGESAAGEPEPAPAEDAAPADMPVREPAVTEAGETAEPGAEFSVMGDGDDALRWLESLAARQGAKEEELLTSPEERTEAPPEWVQSMQDEEAGEGAGALEGPALEAGVQAAAENLDWEDLEEEVEAAAGTEQEDLAWIDTLGEKSAPEAEEFLAQPEASVQDTPDWPAPSGEEAAPSAEEEAEQLASWLEGAEESGEAEEAELPAWLQEIDLEGEPAAQAPLAGATQAAGEEAPEETEGVPDWLQEIAAGGEEGGEPGAATEDIPDWLQETMIGDSPLDLGEAEQAAGEVAEPASELPDWLEGLGESEAEAPEPETGEQAPAWMSETMMTSSPLGELAAEGEEAGEVDEPEQAEAEALPDWMERTGVQEQPAAAETAAESDQVEEEYAWKPEEGEPEPAPTVPAPEPSPPARQPAPALSAWLDDARSSLQDGDIDASLGHYRSLIKKRAHLDEVIGDLKQALEYEHPVNIHLWTALGDAYARNDNLQQALDALTRAEDLLR